MSTQPPSPLDPLYLALPRKLVLLLLLMITSAIGLVSLLLHARVSMPVVAFLLTDAIMGLVAGFSVRWILNGKALVLRICLAVVFIIGGLGLLGWFTGWDFGIELFRVGHAWKSWWEIGQVSLASGFAFLAFYAWQAPSRRPLPVNNKRSLKKMPHPPRKSHRRSKPVAAVPAAATATSLQVQPDPPKAIAVPAKPKRKRLDPPKPRLILSGPEEHRCPYCLELVDPADPRGVVECEICHTLHHADCWSITGACQVPHFTA